MSDLWEEILLTIRRQKWRSIMTAFGVFWGMFMLVILVGCGLGFSNGIMKGFDNIPANSIILFSNHTSLAYEGFGKYRDWNMDNDDLEMLNMRLGDKLRFLSPIVWTSSSEVSVGNASGNFEVMGLPPSYQHTSPQKILWGRYLNEIDIRERRKVCVIGEQVAETLFPEGVNPCGKILKAGSIYYTIIGVTTANDNIQLGFNVKSAVQIPYTTAQRLFNKNYVEMLIVTLQDDCPTSLYKPLIQGWIKEQHHIHPDDPKAIWTFDLSENIATISAVYWGIGILIWIVGGGTLLAGLIGISNIMLVTVKERTQEIGIRRAIGATPRTILGQIIAESLVLTAASGILGLLSGIGILALIDSITAAGADEDLFFSSPQIPFDIAVAALLILLVGGLLAGWMPARRAMKIKAIEALRDE